MGLSDSPHGPVVTDEMGRDMPLLFGGAKQHSAAASRGFAPLIGLLVAVAMVATQP